MIQRNRKRYLLEVILNILVKCCTIHGNGKEIFGHKLLILVLLLVYSIPWFLILKKIRHCYLEDGMVLKPGMIHGNGMELNGHKLLILVLLVHLIPWFLILKKRRQCYLEDGMVVKP